MLEQTFGTVRRLLLIFLCVFDRCCWCVCVYVWCVNFKPTSKDKDNSGLGSLKFVLRWMKVRSLIFLDLFVCNLALRIAPQSNQLSANYGCHVFESLRGIHEIENLGLRLFSWLRPQISEQNTLKYFCFDITASLKMHIWWSDVWKFLTQKDAKCLRWCWVAGRCLFSVKI